MARGQKMATLKRTAEAIWAGNLAKGAGEITTESNTLSRSSYSFKTRFEQAPGTNPEELIAAAHAACYSMALAHMLGEKGYASEQIETKAICSLEPQAEGGFKITIMQLRTEGTVPGLDEDTFQNIAQQAEMACPISNALRGSVKIELEAKLLVQKNTGVYQ
jgi:lipoyl-dependent peroxiredoxin